MTPPSTSIVVVEIPFALNPSQPGVWTHDGDRGAIVAVAPARTDLYVDPATADAADSADAADAADSADSADSADAVSQLNAATLLGTAPPGDFQLACRVRVDFAAQFDAGVLLLWIDAGNWAKFCFEYSPRSEPMVVSVVTRGVSDDANAFVVAEPSVFLRVSRIDGVFAFHASGAGTAWELIRVFRLGEARGERQGEGRGESEGEVLLGFGAQSPTGDGCRVTFDQLRFIDRRLRDLRDGS